MLRDGLVSHHCFIGLSFRRESNGQTYNRSSHRKSSYFLLPSSAATVLLRGAAARDFDCGQGGEAGASPQRAVTAEPTQATGKRPAARRVFGQRAVWHRCSSVEDPQGIFSLVAPRHTALCPKTAPLIVIKRAVNLGIAFRFICVTTGDEKTTMLLTNMSNAAHGTNAVIRAPCDHREWQASPAKGRVSV